MPASEMHPTREILLACLRLDKERAKRSWLVGVTEQEWLQVLDLSLNQGVTPLLYRQLNQSEPGLSLPQPVTSWLRNVYLASLAEAMRLYRQIEAVLRRLHVEGIRVIPLKGIYLAEMVYGNIGLRPMADVDLLIERQNLARAVEVMADLGYRPAYPFQVEQECRDMHHLPGLNKPDCVGLELHWHYLPPSSPFNIPIDQVWEEAQPGLLVGAEALEMTPEDLLLHLCLHAGYLERLSSGIRPLCDIGWTIRVFRQTLDWGRLELRAKAWGAERSVYMMLRVTQRLLGINLPEDFLESLHVGNINPSLESSAIQQILEPAGIGGKLAEVWAPQPWQKRLWRFGQNLFPMGYEMRQAYPELAHGLCWPLAYAKHLGIVLRRNRQAAWDLLTGDAETRAAARQSQAINRLVDWQGGN